MNCKFLNNNANGFGGAAYIISAYYENATVKFTNCTFSGNTGSLGGALCDMMGVQILNCRFSNNTANTKGGAYYVFANKESKIVNSIFDHNNAQLGGGMYNKGNILMINCDFVNNEATEDSGGMYNETKYSKIYNSIFWGNIANGSANQIVGTSKYSYCAIQGGFDGTNIINLESDNDGTESGNYPRFENPGEGNYYIDRYSVCVDAGDKSVTGVTGPDILGNQRIVNNQIDLGAIECQYGLSVDDLDVDSFTMHPNPVENQLIVKKDGALKIEVYNALGQRIISTEATDEIIVNTSEWEKGVYLVKVNGKTMKVLK